MIITFLNNFLLLFILISCHYTLQDSRWFLFLRLVFIKWQRTKLCSSLPFNKCDPVCHPFLGPVQISSGCYKWGLGENRPSAMAKFKEKHLHLLLTGNDRSHTHHLLHLLLLTKCNPQPTLCVHCKYSWRLCT